MSGLQALGITVELGRRPVLDGVDLEARPGELLGLLGPNGAGKTTLLRVLAGLQPAHGHVTIDGQALESLNLTQRARKLAYLPQGNECHWPLLTREVVALGRLPHRAPWRPLPAADADVIDVAMRETDVLELADRPVNHLSGGERTRVLLARALATGAPVLLADEPVAGLDPAHQLQVMQLLKARAQAGGTVIVVLHDLSLAARFCDRLCLLAEGSVVSQGDAKQVLSPSSLKQAYGIHAWFGEAAGEPLVVALNRVL